ncbi:MAG: type II secretion system protein [Candidatus Yanofskybacteria bacterium]|nr:type II secretion system protein [Candidatus Yanofskybacteria bacterium]
MYKKLIRSNSRGFTLVELLVVIAIIGILATLVLLQLGVARSKARDAKRIADISQIRTASELFFDDNGGTYPTGALCPATGVACRNQVAPNWNGNDLSQYISATLLPSDPLTNAAYGYAWNPVAPANRTQYQTYAELERSAPAAFSADSDIDASAWPAASRGVAGGNEACTTAANDCVYDQGQR